MIFKTSPARQTMRREMVLEKPLWTVVLEEGSFVPMSFSFSFSFSGL